MQKTDRIAFEYCDEIVELVSSTIQHDVLEVTGSRFYRCQQPENIHLLFYETEKLSSFTFIDAKYT